MNAIYTIGLKEAQRQALVNLLSTQRYDLDMLAESESVAKRYNQQVVELQALNELLKGLPSKPASQQTYFLNIYEYTKISNALEVSADYSLVLNCLVSTGMYIPVPHIGYAQLAHMVQKTYTELFSSSELPPELNAEAIVSSLNEHDYFVYYALDKNGEGYVIAIEHAPGQLQLSLSSTDSL